MADLFVIRHGQTTANAAGIIQGPRIDAPLSELGARQAAAVAEAFSQTHLDAVYASPMLRARDTASALAPHASQRVVPELYEMDFGDFCGHTMDDVRPRFQPIVDAWDLGFLDRAFPGGESPVLVQHRVRAFAERLLDEARRDAVAVVAHGRLNRVLLSMLTGAGLGAMGRFGQHNASITHLHVADSVSLRRLDDTTHLT